MIKNGADEKTDIIPYLYKRQRTSYQYLSKNINTGRAIDNRIDGV